MPEHFVHTTLGLLTSILLNRSDCYLAMNIILFKALLQMSLIWFMVQYLYYAALIFMSLMNITKLLSVGFDLS